MSRALSFNISSFLSLFSSISFSGVTEFTAQPITVVVWLV